VNGFNYFIPILLKSYFTMIKNKVIYVNYDINGKYHARLKIEALSAPFFT